MAAGVPEGRARGAGVGWLIGAIGRLVGRDGAFRTCLLLGLSSADVVRRPAKWGVLRFSAASTSMGIGYTGIGFTDYGKGPWGDPEQLMADLGTERLLIRPTREGDAEDVYLYMSDPGVMRYRACGVLDREGVAQWVTRVVESGRHYQQFVGKIHQIVLRSSGRVIGYCYLDVPWPEGYRDLMTDGRLGFADLSYGLARAHWGKGYATEAARAVVAHGFGVAGVEKVGAAVNPGNLASIRVLRRLAMEYRREIEWPRQGTVEFYLLSRDQYVQQRRG